jgi:molybdate/tungstate transport system permease protein
LLKKKIRLSWMMIAFILPGTLLLIFVVVPPLKMVLTVSPHGLLDTLDDTVALRSIWLTFYASLIATIVGFVLGVPLAYLLARSDFPGKGFIEGLINVPIVIPHTVAGIALLFVFGRSFLVGRAFGSIGLHFVDSTAGIVVAMMFVSVPFLVNSAQEGFRQVDVRLENVARTLGASRWQSFLTISLPLASRSILAGGIMMWARGISEFGAIVIIAYHPSVAPVLAYERLEMHGLSYAQPLAVMLIIMCLALLVAMRFLLSRGKTE